MKKSIQSFEDWLMKFPVCMDGDSVQQDYVEEKLESAWNASKENILRFLDKEERAYNPNQGQREYIRYLIEKIEKL